MLQVGQTKAAFRIVDFGKSRSDLASRTEVKYTIPHADIDKLRSMLVGRCKQQVHNNPVSVVHSVYFDDPAFSACYANLNGDGQRNKLRLRWYDTLDAPANFFFEIKWRNNRVTGKHRMEVHSDTPLHSRTYKQISEELHKITPPEYLHYVLKYSEPVVLVQYKRQHFISHDQDLRVTLDYDITFYDQVAKRSIATRFPKKLDGLLVMEGKTPVGREAELRKLLQPISPRTARCSKYVHGCRLLGHIHHGE